MKRVLIIAMFAMAAMAANAQTFNTVSFNSTIPGSSAVFVASGNSYTANLTGFQLNANNLIGDITWIYDFDATGVGPYSAVTIEIGGDTINGSVRLAGNEKVFDMSGAPVQVVNGTIDGVFSGGADVTPWTYTQTFVFSQPVTIGQAQKDILSLDNLSGTGITNVHYVKQTFTPVPEPATMAVLGLGLAAIARRRRNR